MILGASRYSQPVTARCPRLADFATPNGYSVSTAFTAPNQQRELAKIIHRRQDVLSINTPPIPHSFRPHQHNNAILPIKKTTQGFTPSRNYSRLTTLRSTFYSLLWHLALEAPQSPSRLNAWCLPQALSGQPWRGCPTWVYSTRNSHDLSPVNPNLRHQPVPISRCLGNRQQTLSGSSGFLQTVSALLP
jgi:hypothetical protein